MWSQWPHVFGYWRWLQGPMDLYDGQGKRVFGVVVLSFCSIYEKTEKHLPTTVYKNSRKR